MAGDLDAEAVEVVLHHDDMPAVVGADDGEEEVVPLQREADAKSPPASDLGARNQFSCEIRPIAHLAGDGHGGGDAGRGLDDLQEPLAGGGVAGRALKLAGDKITSSMAQTRRSRSICLLSVSKRQYLVGTASNPPFVSSPSSFSSFGDGAGSSLVRRLAAAIA